MNFTTADNLWDTYKYLIYAGISLGALGALGESIHLTNSDLEKETECDDDINNTIIHIKDGVKIVGYSLVGGFKSGILVATAPVSIPYYVYTRSRKQS